ncbi:MAG: preprotein translocase subunit SecE [Candidatus Portnoybacteria bacterium]|nr:preprotein translocase subunit SecE [Candidatus Portnoybacteria bacterium]
MWPGGHFKKLIINMNPLKRVSTFLKEVKVEMKKVNWPSKKDTTKYTLIVIGVSFAVAIFLGGLDFLFTWIISLLI